MATSLASLLMMKHLRLIAAIAEHRQLSIAADALAMTQPAASPTLAGAALFERHPKGMTLTDGGESLARRARSAITNGTCKAPVHRSVAPWTQLFWRAARPCRAM